MVWLRARRSSLSGATGSEVLTFGAETSAQKVIDAINQVKDATGVEASLSGTTIKLKSTNYGSSQFVDLKLQNNTTIGSVIQDARNAGTDVVATVNGIAAKGDGNQLSVNTSTLDLSTTVQAGFTGTSSFDITGGGALFQLGPDVVSNQQARIGITSVNTAKLGGVGRYAVRAGLGRRRIPDGRPDQGCQHRGTRRSPRSPLSAVGWVRSRVRRLRRTRTRSTTRWST